MTKIAKGECRGKRKFHFRFDYAEPQPIFVFTKIGEQYNAIKQVDIFFLIILIETKNRAFIKGSVF